ncbi:hypothetical protein BBK36DRAFT_1129896 [Trichoderma citrinoviride]|uniref:BZIP domain-containing protein n=1 Tax=Trichoderma citrinoviride TaxID=58853 RepID=A0A2T4AYI2_9HYPO|nr:hypothetical protein BBK36DRAFT_1129896 [Trichoderma citrinoviride]PTB62132.1 hypothetical protein BBK36DRAFT_1129896 [Trichoderma citrinoviride]
MISKWSSSCPKQKATRIRNNQRRHRAKVKAHISDLESELAESRRQLAAAEHRIKALTAEVEQLQSEARREPCSAPLTPAYHHTSTHDHQPVLEPRCCWMSGSQRQLGKLTTHDQDVMINSSLTNGTERDNFNLALSFVAQYKSQNLPPPQPGESTTSCAAAYSIIAQQNFKGFGLDDIHQWLQSGYRQAIRSEDGCAVANSLVHSLINHLSPV